MEDSKTLLCSSKFPQARERISPKFVDSLGTRAQIVSPALSQTAKVLQRLSTTTDCSHNAECSCTRLVCSLTDKDCHGVRSVCFSHNVTEQSATGIQMRKSIWRRIRCSNSDTIRSYRLKPSFPDQVTGYFLLDPFLRSTIRESDCDQKKKNPQRQVKVKSDVSAKT